MSGNKLKINAEKMKYMIVKSVKKEQRAKNLTLRCSDGTQIELNFQNNI